MSTTLTKHQVRDPDIVTLELKRGFRWSTQHSKIIFVGITVFIVAGLAYSAMQYFNEQSEVRAQEAYFKAEKELVKKTEAFEKYSLKDGKTEGEKATGDFATDYGSIATSLNQVIANFPNSKAAMMAAIALSAQQLKYDKGADALSVLQKIKTGKDLLSAMVLLQKGRALATQHDCKTAIDTWELVGKMSEANFLAPELHLQQGLCYESLGDKTKATESYNKVLAESKDSPLAKNAAQYLRLMKFSDGI